MQRRAVVHVWKRRVLVLESHNGGTRTNSVQQSLMWIARGLSEFRKYPPDCPAIEDQMDLIQPTSLTATLERVRAPNLVRTPVFDPLSAVANFWDLSFCHCGGCGTKWD
mmetsp:Transcript_45360/g.71142  ORF Transcript_45360/g.71142 Transcript_45360/m.71142 type:complete len:109 (-) Transcript_45360:645-971(-)